MNDMKERKLGNREISEFCRSLSLLLRAGIHPGDGLFLMAEEESGEMKAILEEMGQSLDQGLVLSQVIEEQKNFALRQIKNIFIWMKSALHLRQ